MELFNKSGSRTSDFRTYNKGDSILHYMFFMYKDNAMLMSLADKKIDGGAGVESAVANAALPEAAPVNLSWLCAPTPWKSGWAVIGTNLWSRWPTRQPRWLSLLADARRPRWSAS